MTWTDKLAAWVDDAGLVVADYDVPAVGRAVVDAIIVGVGVMRRENGRLATVDPYQVAFREPSRAVSHLVDEVRRLLDLIGCAHRWDPDCARCATFRPVRWALDDVAGPDAVVPADMDRPCGHPDMTFHVEVARIVDDDGGDPVAFSASVMARCVACNEPFCWVVPAGSVGLSPARPMISPDAQELRAPLRPRSAEPSFGLGLPGFQVRETSGVDRSDCDPGV